MSQYKKLGKDSEGAGRAMRRLIGLSDPAISGYVARLRSRYGKYALPADKVRRIIDKSMGDHTLTEVLYQSRQEEF